MEANPSGATDIGGAVNRLSTLFATEPEGQPTDAEVVQDAPETEEVEVKADTPEGDTQPETETYKVKVGDEEKEVTIEELRKGYMMESDYRQKTSEVAERRKASEAKELELDQRLAATEVMLDVDLKAMQSQEMLDLKENDPEAYLQKFESVQKRYQAFQGEHQKRQSEKQALHNELIKKELELLDTAIPEWLDEEVKAKEANDLTKRWSEMGYSAEEINGFVDHRRIVESRKAMLYDKLMSQDLSSKEVKAPPKAQQPGTATAGEDRVDQRIKDMRGKLRKTGKVQDAAKLFRSLME